MDNFSSDKYDFDTHELSLDESSNEYTSLSPYLNFDPMYLPAQPEYIFPTGQKQRGIFEYAFYYIGGSCMVGAAIGGCRGFYNGLNLTTLAGQRGTVQRTRIINHMMKQGAATANTLGSIAFIYSGLGVIMQQVRGCDDELNHITSATLTGFICKLPGGVAKCAIGGLAGFALSSAYCLYISYDKFENLREILRLQPINNKATLENEVKNTNYEYTEETEY